MTEYEFERGHYRIEYPTAARPRFQRYIRERHRGFAW